jgi:hypothetical protein
VHGRSFADLNEVLAWKISIAQSKISELAWARFDLLDGRLCSGPDGTTAQKQFFWQDAVRAQIHFLSAI